MKKTLIFIVICLAMSCKNADKSPQSSAESSAEMKEIVMQEPPPPAMSKRDKKVLDDFKKLEIPANSAALSNANADTTSSDAAPIKHIIFPTSTYSTPLRKIVRTTQIKSKVENTEQATYKIEQIARKFNGFVMQTHLESRNLEKSETPISQDSTLETTQFEVANTLVLRVPNERLDTFLTELSRVYTHLDYRRVNAQDLTATFLTNELKAQVRDNSAQRIAQASDEKGKRLNEIVDAEETRVNMKDAAIEQQIQNLETDYDIAFSIVNVAIYQNPVVAKTMKTNVNSLKAASNFGFRLTQALSNGWSIVLEILLFFVNLWAFIVLGLGAYFVYRKFKMRDYLLLKS
jgi:Domain of unknown function (DUF4349)